MNRPPAAPAVALFVLCALASPSRVRALETDQYWSWHRPLADSTEAVNAWFNLAVTRVLDQEAQHSPGVPLQCEEVRNRIGYRLEFEIFQDVELWTFHSSLVDRAPASPEEVDEFESGNIYSNHPPLDIGNWLPHSPTIEINGVRIGTDKLAHFVSSGWKYYRIYRWRLNHGHDAADAYEWAVRWGVLEERSINGLLAVGVFSRADMESNASGLRFYIDLCDGDDPYLAKVDGRWGLRRSVDLAEYVTPEWDESYQNSIYAGYRWKWVRPMLLAHCPDLADPVVQGRIARYRAVDRETPSEKAIAALVASGELAGPGQFSLEANCATRPIAVAAPEPGTASVRVSRREPDRALMAEVAARQADVEPQVFTLAAVRLDYPRRLTGSLGLLFAKVPREIDCRVACDLRGVFAQVEPGLAGGQLSVGWGRLIGDTGPTSRFLANVHLAGGVRASLLRTWGDSPLGDEPQTLAGVEGELTITRVNFTVGLFRAVSGAGPHDDWVVTGGIGWGF